MSKTVNDHDQTDEVRAKNTVPVELGKPFDALAPGLWVDMYGRSVEIDAADFQEIVENTKAALESTVTSGGELVGLPIDQRNHEKSEAAGFIVDVELQGDNLIAVIPQWNEVGRDLIARKIFRYFSATYSPKEKVIIGGSLVNWSALTHANGKRALRPIELGANAIAEDTASDGEEQAVIDGEVYSMDITKAELMEAVGEIVEQKLKSTVAANFGITEDGTQDADGVNVDLSAFINMDEAADELTDAYRKKFVEMTATLKRKAEVQHLEFLARVNRESDIAEFSSVAVNGNNEVSRGLPVDQDGLKKWLLSLDGTQLEFAKKMISGIQEKGLIEFSEKGHGASVKNLDPLPDEFAELLEDKLYTVAELKKALEIADGVYDFGKWEN